MTSLFDDLQQGLQEAIDYSNGKGSARVTKFTIEPVEILNHNEIKAVRLNANMTQVVFADYLGVSVKTVEAWEKGRTHPTGPACRLMNLLSTGNFDNMPFIEIG